MRLIKTLSVAAVSLLAQPALAGYSSTGTISNVIVDLNGIVTFDSSTGHSAPPGCQDSSSPGQWAFSSASLAGQAKLAALLTAYATHKQVMVGGTATCGDRSDTETVQFLRIDDA